MNEPKFTPGPWRVCDGYRSDHGDRGIRSAPHPVEQPLSTETFERNVAVAALPEGGLWGEANITMVANAHLIAAAPDLYAALLAQASVENLDGSLCFCSERQREKWNSQQHEPWCDAANLALAKARGEP